MWCFEFRIGFLAGLKIFLGNDDRVKVGRKDNLEKKDFTMSKHEIIDLIREINTTAKVEFLADFTRDQLDKYLDNLLEVDLETMAICA